MAADGNGRWWLFVVTSETLVIVEKKSAPSHLQNISSLEVCTPLQQVLRELQDIGEACG